VQFRAHFVPVLTLQLQFLVHPVLCLCFADLLFCIILVQKLSSYATSLPIVADNHAESTVDKIKPSCKTDKLLGTYDVTSNQDEMGEDIGMMVNDCHRAVLGSGNDEIVFMKNSYFIVLSLITGLRIHLD